MKLTVYTPIIDTTTITARYSDGKAEYAHIFTTEHTIADDPAATRLAQWLSISHSAYLFSIEYYDEIETEFALTKEEITFFEQVFYDGMAEFRYVNGIPITTKTVIRSSAGVPVAPESSLNTNGALLLNGGGKDGLTAGLLLKQAGVDFSLFQIGTGVAQRLTQDALKADVALFTRTMEPRRLEGKYQGHRPTSANIAIAAALTALITGKKDVIASNENSANEPNLELDGVSINHQFTKTYEFEKQFSSLLATMGIPVRYFSIMRPFHELQIAKMLTTYPDSSSLFISCNHGFRRGFWCGVCAKCAFIALMFTALEPRIVQSLFGSKDVINKPELKKHIEELVRPELSKPLECVGTLEESQIAAYLIMNRHRELISADIEALFIEVTRHIQDADIASFLSSINTLHTIPSDYEPVLQVAFNKLGA